jgi:hypothetical protein
MTAMDITIVAGLIQVTTEQVRRSGRRGGFPSMRVVPIRTRRGGNLQ